MSHTYDYPRPAVAADVALFHAESGRWHVLLIQRKNEPFRDCWALPGGFLDENEDPTDAAHRELAEETGITGVVLEPLCFRGKPGRDPRGHIISLVHWGIIEGARPAAIAADDAKALAWHPLDQLPTLAFDHGEILGEVIALLESA